MKKVLENYQDLCTQYYDLDNTLPIDEWEFYKVYADNAQGIILEPMCGTGRLLIPLVQAGFDVEGFDASAHMLARLTAKAATVGVQSQVWQSFIEDVEIEQRRYALIIIAYGSFNLITDQAAVLASLQKLFDLLKPGGLFVFECITLDYIASIEPGVVKSGIVTRSDGKTIVNLSMQHSLHEGVSVTQSRYVLFDGDVPLATEQEEYQLRFYTDSQIDALLGQVGFIEIKKIKTFVHQQAPSQSDSTVIFECKKP